MPACGGSTELTVGTDQPHRALSIPIGAVTATESDLTTDPPRPEDLTNVIGAVQDELERIEMPAIIDHLGGPELRPAAEAVMAERLAQTGIDPKRVGERVLEAIRNRTFYAFVSAVPADTIRARHRRIEAELETSWTTIY